METDYNYQCFAEDEWSTQAAVGTTSRRAAAGRAELLANFFGGAVWGNFRENANCGDPPG